MTYISVTARRFLGAHDRYIRLVRGSFCSADYFAFCTRYCLDAEQYKQLFSVSMSENQKTDFYNNNNKNIFTMKSVSCQTNFIVLFLVFHLNLLNFFRSLIEIHFVSCGDYSLDLASGLTEVQQNFLIVDITFKILDIITRSDVFYRNLF